MDLDKKEILDFAKRQELCVISTCFNEQPESAVVDFIIEDNLDIIFNTYTTSRKYKNLKTNPNVSFVVGFGETLQTLQGEGVATELEGHEESRIINAYKDNLGFFRRWKIKDMRYFKIRVSWIRLSDFSEYPPKEKELKVDRW